MIKSIEFDDYVLAGIGNGTLNIDQWQLQVPLDVRSQVVALVEAPNWDELPQVEMVEGPSEPTREEVLTRYSLTLGIVAVAAILCGIIFGFIFQSSLIVYLCLTVAALGIGATIWLQSRPKGIAAALGLAPSIEGTATRANFVRSQMSIAETLRITGIIVSLTLSMQLVWALCTIDYRYLGEEDSTVVALIRSGLIFFIPIAIWIAWYQCRQKRGAVFKVARCVRGFLGRNLSPLWVSWLYEAKRNPTEIPVLERSMKKVGDNLLLLAFFLICFVFFADTQWLDGKFSPEPVPLGRNGKWNWVNAVVQWMFEHPNSTLFMAAPLGSFSIAAFAYQSSKLLIPKSAGRFALAIFFLSILLFAIRVGAWTSTMRNAFEKILQHF